MSSRGPATTLFNSPKRSAGSPRVMEQEGGRDDPRPLPFLGTLLELLPWIHQWHDRIDPTFGGSIAQFFEGFVDEEARDLGITRDTIRARQPPQKKRRTRRHPRAGKR